MQASLEPHLSQLYEIVKRFKKYLPKQRPPFILITGKIGNGKTTTINTLFGKKVGKVSHTSRGTSTDNVYEWENKGENIHIIDVPGLGDTTENDERSIRDIYNKRAKEADGFLVVTCPPRFAEEGTLKTIRALLDAGVDSNHVIFGFNKLSHLDYAKDDEDLTVVLDGLSGPVNSHDIEAIHKAKEDFLLDLHQNFPAISFSLEQIIEYDSKSGWNLYKLFHAVLEVVPFQTVYKLRHQVSEAHEEISNREQKQMELLEAERKAAKKAALMEFEAERSKFEDDSIRKFLTGIEKIIGTFDLDTEREFRSIKEKIATAVEEATEEIADKAEKVFDKVDDTIEKASEVIDSAKKKIKNVWDSFTSWF
jgi:predicted GTPase